jgi:membrane protease subunit (stomatin/prohibitin family)
VSKLGEGLAESGISILDLAANYTELGEKLKPIFQAEFDAWGIELGKFYIENITLPEEVEKMLDKTSQLNLMQGKLNQFNQMQSGIAMEKLAENEGGGALGAGIILPNMMQSQQPVQENKQQLLDVLKQLGELKDSGIITEEEFAKKKAEILGKL